MSGESNSRGDHTTESSVHHVVHIDQSFLSEVEGSMQELPRLLTTGAGRDSCCIFRVPQSLSEINKKAYHPYIVSIGPFHHGKTQLQMIQEHKWRYLRHLLLRTESKRVVLKDFFEAVAPMEEEIRKSYSETLEFDGRDLIRMMVLDGCFVIELFWKVARMVLPDPRDPLLTIASIVPADPHDPLFTMAWVLPALMRDLLRLENQIPYFVLQKLFDLSVGSGNDGPSLAKLALWFFNCLVQRPVHVLENCYDKEGKHLLDLFHLSYIPDCQEKQRRPSRSLHLIRSAKELNQAGVKFKPRKTHSILDVKFRNGVLEIPLLTIDDFWSSLFLNFVAFEQCYCLSSKHFTTYANLMGCLIKTPADAGFLGYHKIIENYIGTDEEVALFFNNVRKDVAFDVKRSYLSKVFEEVNESCRNYWHVQWAEFMHTYFNTPWSFMSAAAALLLLLLTMTQTSYAVYQSYRPADPPK
ncbi:UPF0481 protein At3g47200 [Eucalyptus grandis]|uniref:Uncharacterized protein n=2 Tax=Eucalyptus grandis TaxID=71139 RepID=A0ACC3LY29_EUCGR|nr:UPF0481 protein At3g47200 [Eucalyptus grandis]KAK3443819.1 hypothetical protein EUGRSUZ_B03888 [Eucalyptus grandis]